MLWAQGWAVEPRDPKAPLWPLSYLRSFHDKGLFRSEGRKFFRDKLKSGGLGPLGRVVLAESGLWRCPVPLGVLGGVFHVKMITLTFSAASGRVWDLWRLGESFL